MLAKKNFESLSHRLGIGGLGKRGCVFVVICSLTLCHYLDLNARCQAQSSVANADVNQPSAAKQAKIQELEEKLRGIREQNDLPALWAGRFEVGMDLGIDDSKSYFAAAGIRNSKENLQVTSMDLIHLGSCTKAMTATMIAQAVSNGKLRFDSTLAEIFSEDEKVHQSTWKNTTVRQMLEHRSGMPANALWSTVAKSHPNQPIASRRGVLHWVLGKSRPEKTDYLYSNVGYCLLGHILEELEGKSWEELIERDLFKPLEMKSASFGPVRGKQRLAQPWGHIEVGYKELLQSTLGVEVQGWNPIQFDNPVPLGPAGRCHMNMQDWSKFVAVFSSQGKIDPRLGISLDVWKDLKACSDPKSTVPYAGGWVQASQPQADGQVLIHDGSNTTWYCFAWVAPQKRLFVLVACNAFSDSVRRACQEIARQLATGND
ncbi:MAG: serine hydrolase domain-containing protein [Planctomycetota bacterium]